MSQTWSKGDLFLFSQSEWKSPTLRDRLRNDFGAGSHFCSAQPFFFSQISRFRAGHLLRFSHSMDCDWRFSSQRGGMRMTWAGGAYQVRYLTAKRPQCVRRPRKQGACALKSPQLAIAIPSYCTLALIRPNQVPFKMLKAPQTGRWVACVAVCLVENEPLRLCRWWQFASRSLIPTLVYELQVFQLPVGRMSM